jgi:acetoin utilization protein AcuB
MSQRVPQIISVLTPFPHSVDIDAPIHEARTFMRQFNIRHLPVTENKKLAGIITDRDIKLILGPEFDFPTEEELTVRDAYIDDAYVVDVSTPLDEVLFTMAEKHIGSALVTKQDKLVGIFTSNDACRHFAEFIRERVRTPSGDDAA